MLADFKNLMAGVYRGDSEASQTLISEYGDLILRVVRRHLSASIRSQFDSTDFVQEVWLAFLRDLPKGRVFETPSRLGAFLVLMARNKVVDAMRHTLMFGKNDVHPGALLEHDAVINKGLVANNSTPSARAIRADIQNSALESLRPAHRRIGQLLLAGQDCNEVSQELKINLRTVERVRERILDFLQKQ